MDDMNSKALSQRILTALDDIKLQQIVLLDIRAYTTIADFMLLASGNSRRHNMAAVRKLRSALKLWNITPIGVEGEEDGEWVLIDLGEVVVHIMQPQIRDYYQLEKLWSIEYQQQKSESMR